MNVFDAIERRRAIKGFDAQHVMPDADVRRLITAAMQSPTSFNIQHWRFVVLRDKALRAQIRAAAFDQSQITDASLVVLLTADAQAWRKNPERYWRDAPKQVADMLVGWMGPFHQGNERLQIDEAQRSIGMAMMTLMLAAQELGYDSCPMIGFDAKKVAELVRLPSDHVIGPIVAIGKKTKDPWPKPGQLSYEEVVVTDRFA
jgi:nitroreductase